VADRLSDLLKICFKALINMTACFFNGNPISRSLEVSDEIRRTFTVFEAVVEPVEPETVGPGLHSVGPAVLSRRPQLDLDTTAVFEYDSVNRAISGGAWLRGVVVDFDDALTMRLDVFQDLADGCLIR
jgi:hypothetical protein